MPANRASHIGRDTGQDIQQPHAGDVHYPPFAVLNPLNLIALRVSTGRYIPLRRQEGKKLDDMRVAQRRGVLLGVEQDEELDPIQVGVDGPPAVAVNPHVIRDGLEKGDLAMVNTSSLKCPGAVIPFNHGDGEAKYLLISDNCRENSKNSFKLMALRFFGNNRPAAKGIPSNNCYEVDQTSLTDCYVAQQTSLRTG